MHKILLLAAAVAIPAAAYSSLAPRRQPLCFASGSATYRIAPETATPDFRVKIAADASSADLRMQLVDRPEIADFVLVDDFSAETQRPCRSSVAMRTVGIEHGEMAPDVVVALSADAGAADYKIYVHSLRYSQQDAAALLAAMWKADRLREGARFDGPKTADRVSQSSTILAVNPAE